MSGVRDKVVKVGMVLDQPFPPDARVEREASALAEAGYQVHLLCEARENETDREAFHRGLYIHRVRPEEVTYRLPLLNVQTRFPYRGLFKNINRTIWNIDTAWLTLIRRFVTRLDIDVLHIHDLRLVSTGLAVASKYNIPLVADLHENYPALMEMLKGRDNPAMGKRQRAKWENVEKFGAWQADRVITVIEEARDRLVAKGIRHHKITVLPNTVDATKFMTAPIDPTVTKRFKSTFLLTYVGHINNTHRGIHTLIEAMGILRDEIPELFFVGAGAVREKYYNELMALVDQYDLHGRMEFTGWLDESEFVSYVDASDICVCPHVANPHTHTTFPNKVYLYNLFGKPVITSDCAPLKRYIEETGGGVCFESENAHDLADKIRLLYKDKLLRKQMGDNGRQAVLHVHNWDNTAPRLIDLYDNLTAEASLAGAR